MAEYAKQHQVTDKEIIHNLRNPWGKSPESMTETRFEAATRIEQWTDAYENMRDFAISKGLDVTCYADKSGDNRWRHIVTIKTTEA